MNEKRVSEYDMKCTHQLVNGRRNKNYISHIYQNAQWIKGDQDIEKLFCGHFQLQLGTHKSHKFLLDWQNLFTFKERVDLTPLKLSFTLKNINQAVFEINIDNTLGPDGFKMSSSKNIGVFFIILWRNFMKNL